MLKHLLTLSTILGLTLALNTCGKRVHGNPDPIPELDGQVALNFMNQYTGYLQSQFPALDETPGMLEWVEAHPDVSVNFKRALSELLEEGEKEAPGYGLGFDPILDAQDFPDDGFVI